jgi:Concanavalin A-like lectin/glucanases superfamily
MNKEETMRMIFSFFTPQKLVLPFMMCMVGAILYLASQDVNAMTSKTYYYAFAIAIPLLIVLILVLRRSNMFSIEFNTQFVIYVSIAIIFTACMFYVYYEADSATKLLFQAAVTILSIAIAIVALAILFKASGNYFKKLGGSSGFVAKLIFYIPCLFLDAFQQLMVQFQQTPRVTLYLFVFELILVGLFAVMNYYSKTGFMGGTLIQKDPVFLDLGKETTIATSDKLKDLQKELYKISNKNSIEDPKNSYLYERNFSLSFWVLTNPIENFGKEGKIISYENSTGTLFKPRVTYSFDSSLNQYVYNIYVCDSNTKYSLILPTQKWSQFVFVYKFQTVDLFINGKLHKTFDLTKKINPDDPSVGYSIILGDNSAKVPGAISNVLYYPKPLSGTDVTTIYNFKSFQVDTGIAPTVI